MTEEIKLTARCSAIVATDFCCWFPVIILGILVQTKTITLKPSVFAWCVTFVIPINSAINPYLYTISEIVSSYRKKRVKKGKMQENSANQTLPNSVSTKVTAIALATHEETHTEGDMTTQI